MYSLKEEKISQITPFSVLADNKRIRNKIIDGKSTQATRSGKNKFDLAKVNTSNIVVLNNTGFNLVNAWATPIINYTNLIQMLKPSTTYTCYSKAKVKGRPSYTSTSNHNLVLILNKDGVAPRQLSVIDKTLDIEQISVKTFTTPDDLDGWSMLGYAFHGNNDGSTTYKGIGEIEVKDLMIVEGTYTADNFPDFELYGASPSPEFPSEIKSVGDDVNLLNKQDIINGSLSQGNILQQYNYRLSTNNPILVEPSTNYNINFKELGEFKGIRIGIHSYDSDGNFINDSGWIGFFDTMQTTYTTKNNCKYIRIVFSFSKTSNSVTTGGTEYTGNVTINDFNILKIKLQKGTVATPYSEYGKGTVTIEQRGKNLLENKTKNQGVSNGITFTLNDDGTYILNGANNNNGNSAVFLSSSSNKTMLKAGTYYSIKPPYSNMSLVGYTGSKYINLAKFTLYEDTEMEVYLQVLKGTTTTFNNVKVYPIISTIPITEDDYEPYFSKDYVIQTQPLRSLPNGTKDTIEEDGIHRRVGSVVLDGSEDWKILNSSNSKKRYKLDISTQIKKCENVNTIANMLCNSFKAVTPNNTYQNIEGITTGIADNNKEILISIADFAEETTVDAFKAWLQSNPITVQYELAEEVVEPFTDEQQAVLNSMKTLEGTNHFSLIGDLQTTLTFDYNPKITEEIKRAFKYNITKAYLEVAATDKASGFQINEDNYLQSIDFDDCRYIEGEGIIGSCVAKELQGKFVNVDTSFDIENRELECFIGAETEDNITHYLRLGTFIVQKPENDNVKENTSFDSLDYMIKFNKEYVHRMAKYLKTKDTDILQNKQYYILNDSGVYEEVIVPNKEEIINYYEIIDEYTLMQLLKDICEQCEVKLGTFDFRNSNYVVHGNRFDTGTTCRDVLKAIAQAAFSWARINEYNELLLDFETSDIITEEIDYNEYYGLNFNDKYGPVNTIVLKNSQVEGENITVKNDDLINAPSGKNQFDLDKMSWSTDKYSRLPTGFKITNAWATSVMEANNLLKTFKPNTTYTVKVKSKILSKPTNVKENNNNLLMLYRPTGHTLGGVAKAVAWTSKAINELNKEYINIGTFTTPSDMTDVSLLTYAYYGNNDGSTTYYGVGEIEVYDIMMVEGTYTEDNFPDYEPYMKTGTKELAISDNPFAYSEETRKAIIEAGKMLYGFTYVPLTVETIGAAYLNCKDKIKVKNMQDGDLETYVFDTRISYQGTLKSNVETLAMTDTETKYRYDGSLTTAQRRTEFRVDKAEQKIESVIINVTEQNNKISQVTQTVDELNSKISDIADITTSQESINGKVSLEKINQSEPIYVKIYPRAENISYLYPHSNLYPSETLYLKTRTLRFANTSTNKYVDYELPDNLLYFDSENYDEFILDYDAKSCVINKKVGYNADGTTYLLENPKTIEYEYPTIELEDGDYTIELLGYTDAYLFVRLMAQNIYTTQFTTRAEVNSEISQKADEITSTVSKSYATKGELNTAKSEIKQTTDSITSTVSKKVGNDEIISKINQSAEEIQINADKISIEGKAVNFSTEFSETFGPFTNDDKTKVINYMLGNTELTDAEIEKYDLNADGEINTIDALLISKAISAGGYITQEGIFQINPYSAKRSIILKDKDGKIITSMGYKGIQTDGISCEALTVRGQIKTDNIYVKDDDNNIDESSYLNIIESNIEMRKRASVRKLFINDTSQVYGQMLLYDNSSGTSGTVPAGGIWQCFAIEIIYKNDDGQYGSTGMIYNPVGKTTYGTIVRKNSGNTNIMINSALFVVSENTISIQRNSQANMSFSDNDVWNDGNQLYITQVIGYYGG